MKRQEVQPERLLAELSERLESTIAFAEECRWYFSDLNQEAEELSVRAIGLFGRAVRSMSTGQ